MKTLQKQTIEQFIAYTDDILSHPRFLEQQHYIHHKDITLYTHVITVAYRCFKIGKRCRMDVRSLVRGALLHDFFLYDWHLEGKRVRKRGLKRHGFTHAKQALVNAEKYFSLNAKERDIILKHMFPLNIRPPRYVESCIVNVVDKVTSLLEVFGYRPSKDWLGALDKTNTLDQTP